MDRGAWRATIHGVAKSRARLSTHTHCFSLASEEARVFLLSQGQRVQNYSRGVTKDPGPDTPGSPEGNTEGPGTASSEPLLPS